MRCNHLNDEKYAEHRQSRRKAAGKLGGSGVLATVTTGLYISWNGLRLISAATRLQGIFFWDFFIYLVEGMVFVITGLQARTLIARIGDYSISELALSAVVVSALVILARFVWIYPATYLLRWVFPWLKRRNPSPPWQWPFVLAFTGVRGIVSLPQRSRAAGFQSRRGLSHDDSAPISSQNASFPSYKAAR